MPKACKLPSGRVVNLEDLPIEVFEQVTVAVDLPLREWYLLATAPAAFPRAAVELRRVLCERAGEPPPPDGDVTYRNLFDVFFDVADDLPSEYQDGAPLSEADPVTPSSSGAPNDTDGPRLSPVA